MIRSGIHNSIDFHLGSFMRGQLCIYSSLLLLMVGTVSCKNREDGSESKSIYDGRQIGSAPRADIKDVDGNGIDADCSMIPSYFTKIPDDGSAKNYKLTYACIAFDLQDQTKTRNVCLYKNTFGQKNFWNGDSRAFQIDGKVNTGGLFLPELWTTPSKYKELTSTKADTLEIFADLHYDMDSETLQAQWYEEGYNRVYFSIPKNDPRNSKLRFDTRSYHNLKTFGDPERSETFGLKCQELRS